MPLKIESLPVTKEFKLKADPNGETFVVIRQATTGDHRQRYDLLAEVTIVMVKDDGDQEIRQRINMYEQQRLDVYLTLADCNIMGQDDEPFFKFHKGRIRNRAEFERAWDALPPPWAEEIHKCVMAVNPDWDGSRGDFPPLD